MLLAHFQLSRAQLSLLGSSFENSLKVYSVAKDTLKTDQYLRLQYGDPVFGVRHQ